VFVTKGRKKSDSFSFSQIILPSEKKRKKRYSCGMKINPNHLRLGRFIGLGGCGTVFAGTLNVGDQTIDVAIKQVLIQGSASELVNKEVAMMNSLNHKNIIECYGAVLDENAVDANGVYLGCCIVLERCTLSLREALDTLSEHNDGGGGGDNDKFVISSMIASSEVCMKVPSINTLFIA